MKKSDVDTIVQGLAPALLAFVSQKLAPVSDRLSTVEAVKPVDVREVVMETIKALPAPEPLPDTEPRQLVLEMPDVSDFAKAVVALLPIPPEPEPAPIEPVEPVFDTVAFLKALSEADFTDV